MKPMKPGFSSNDMDMDNHVERIQPKEVRSKFAKKGKMRIKEAKGKKKAGEGRDPRGGFANPQGPGNPGVQRALPKAKGKGSNVIHHPLKRGKKLPKMY